MINFFSLFRGGIKALLNKCIFTHCHEQLISNYNDLCIIYLISKMCLIYTHTQNALMLSYLDLML